MFTAQADYTEREREHCREHTNAHHFHFMSQLYVGVLRFEQPNMCMQNVVVLQY